MREYIFCLTLMTFCMTTGFVLGLETFQDLNSGKIFPKVVSVDFDGKTHTLQATGAATRKKFIVNVYSVASYIESPNKSEGFEQMFNPSKIKQLTQIFMQNIEKQKLTTSMNESITKNIPAEQMASLRPVMNVFLAFYSTVSVNDVHELRWYPGGTVELRINGPIVGTVKNEQFAVALWKIWFGDKSIVNREEMFSLL
jgi:hypothetical protein